MKLPTIEGRFGRRLLALLLLSATLWNLGWAAQAFLERRQIHSDSASQAVPANRWQLDTPQIRRLEHFLNTALAPIPPGSKVGMTAPRGNGGEGAGDFFAHMWAAYLHPEYHILLGRGPGNLQHAEYWIDYRPDARAAHRASFEPLVRHPLGNSYRIPR